VPGRSHRSTGSGRGKDRCRGERASSGTGGLWGKATIVNPLGKVKSSFFSARSERLAPGPRIERGETRTGKQIFANLWLFFFREPSAPIDAEGGWYLQRRGLERGIRGVEKMSGVAIRRGEERARLGLLVKLERRWSLRRRSVQGCRWDVASGA